MIIDCHSHIGMDYHHAYSDVKKYLKYIEKLGVDYGMVMPQVNPLYLNNGDYVRPNLHSKNPYEQINNILYNEISSYKNLIYVPYIHTALDETNYLQELYEKMQPVALKVHGIGSRTTVEDFNPQIIKFLKKYDVPLIIHTDYVIEEKNSELKRLRLGNMAIKWAEFLIKNDIRGTLNHGCSYDKKAFEIVNNSKLIRVGLGPDIIVKNNPNRLVDNINGNYLSDIQNYLDIDKIVFDIDYNWNTEDYNDDYQIIERYKTSFEKKKLKKVLGKNAEEFYF